MRAWTRGCIPAVAWAYGIHNTKLGGGAAAAVEDPGTAKSAPPLLFDWASLTKPLVTARLALALVERGLIALESSVSDHVPEVLTAGHPKDLRVNDLLRHTGGFGPDLKLRAGSLPGDAEVWRRVLAAPPVYRLREKCVYSDIGYAILARFLARAAAQDFRELVAEHLLLWNLNEHVTLMPVVAASAWPSVPSDEPTRRGWVHDELALATLARTGNAGAFGDIDGASLSLQGWAHLANAPLGGEAFESNPAGPRGLGWALHGDKHHFVDEAWPLSTASHLGYTGCAVALEPRTGVWSALLTNAVVRGREKPGWRDFRNSYFRSVALFLKTTGLLK